MPHDAILLHLANPSVCHFAVQVRVEKVSFSIISLFPTFFPPLSILHHSSLSECLEQVKIDVPVVGLSWKSRPGLAVSKILTILLKPQ